MFSIEERNGVQPVAIYHRPTGRLMRPSDHQIPVDGLGGLGELDGFLDTLKNFGSGIVKFATAGVYDPSKNRFYVPFSSGQMRNWAQGVTNTTTLGLVKTDKFFNSQTAKTIGAIAGGVAAAGATAAVGRALYTTYGPGATPSGSSVDSGGLLNTGAKTVVQTTAKTAQQATSAGSSVKSIIPSLDTLSKVVDVGSKVIGTMGAGGGGVPQGGGSLIMDQGGPPVVIIPAGGTPMVDPGMVMAPPGMMVQNPTGLLDPNMFGGGVVYSGGGGGGGFGPPGSELVMNEQGQLVPAESSGLDAWTPWLLAGAGVVLLYMVFPGKSVGRRK